MFLPEGNSNGAFQCTIGNVGPSSVPFIDPIVAIGYGYQIGLGDPNFASVILRSIGDNIYDVFFQGQSHIVHAGDQFFFPAGGLSTFGVRGIEASSYLLYPAVLALLLARKFFAHDISDILIENLRRFVMDKVDVEIPGVFRWSLHHRRIKADGQPGDFHCS